MFATRDFQVGASVITGEVREVLSENTAHATQIGRDAYALIGGLMPKVNHSCDPNCGVRISPSGTHHFVARRGIRSGDEITFDYAMRNYAVDNFPERCSCGSGACRGTVAGWKDLSDEQKAAYRPFAAPYLFEIDRLEEPRPGLPA